MEHLMQAGLSSPRRERRGRAGWREAVFMAFALLAGAGPSGAGDQSADDKAQRSLIEEQLGVRIEGLHLSAAGYMIDFRYRVLDPVKAAPLLDRKLNPYLLDEATGARLGVPDAPKVGQLRPSSRGKIIPGRNYYILFANPGRYLQPGSKVTLVAGNAQISRLNVD